jgi:hypothetical protein
MWQFWLGFQALEPSVLLGGIYANKPGYHNYRNALPKSDYSVQLALDKQGPGDMAAAIDLTFPDAQSGRYATIIKYADRLLASGHDPADPRGDYLREFYGQADTDQQVEGWDFQFLVPVTSDSSHLWHIHLSFLRAYLNDPAAFAAVLSILRGQTLAQWHGGDVAMGEFLVLTDGPVPGGTYYSNYNSMRYMPDQATIDRIIAGGGSKSYVGLGKFTVANAVKVFGPLIEDFLKPGPAGPPGPATLVPHTHKPGEAVAT